MQPTPHEPVGADVTGLDLRDLDADAVTRLRELLAEHGVLAIRGQDDLDDAGFVAFLRRLGDLMFTAGETHVDGQPDLNVVTNVGRTTPPKSNWHVDTSYVDVPPAYTALRAVEVPEQGGQTLFTNQVRAHDTLPDDLRERLEGRTIRHVVTGVDPGDDQQTEAEQPAFVRHPISGRRAVYLSTPQRCVAVSGLDEDASRDTVQTLFEHCTREDNVFAHAWAPGDVVIWDNRVVMHKADHSGVVGDRTMHRGMVAGNAPFTD